MEIKTTYQMNRSKGVTMVLYADSGKGKTVALGTLPEGELLIIDADGGMESIASRNHSVVSLLRTDEPEQNGVNKLAQIIMYLRSDECKFKYVAIDSISELEKYVLTSLRIDRGKEYLTIKEYGDTSMVLREYIRVFRDLTERGINIIITALEMPLIIQETSDGVITKAFPKLTKSLAPELCGLVDMVGRLEINDKTGERRIRFKGAENITAKTRVAGVDDFESTDLSVVFSKIKETKNKMKGDGKNG